MQENANAPADHDNDPVVIRAQQQIEHANAIIEQATLLMDNMKTLTNKLHIKEGSGRRYLERIKPTDKRLKEVEEEILKEYAAGGQAGKKPTIENKPTNPLLDKILKHDPI